MGQTLDAHQHIVYGVFLQELEETMTPDQYQKVKGAIDDWDLGRLVSAIDSVNFSPPEARAEPVQHIYYGLGLRDLLKGVGLRDEERRKIINRIAGEEVAHPRTSIELE